MSFPLDIGTEFVVIYVITLIILIIGCSVGIFCMYRWYRSTIAELSNVVTIPSVIQNTPTINDERRLSETSIIKIKPATPISNHEQNQDIPIIPFNNDSINIKQKHNKNINSNTITNYKSFTNATLLNSLNSLSNNNNNNNNSNININDGIRSTKKSDDIAKIYTNIVSGKIPNNMTSEELAIFFEHAFRLGQQSQRSRKSSKSSKSNKSNIKFNDKNGLNIDYINHIRTKTTNNKSNNKRHNSLSNSNHLSIPNHNSNESLTDITQISKLSPAMNTTQNISELTDEGVIIKYRNI